MQKVQFHSDQHAWDLTQGEEVRVEEPHWNVGSCIQLHQNSAMGFSPYYLMCWRQPHLPVDVTLGLVPHTIMDPNASKFVQKLREHGGWAQKKAEVFQAKKHKGTSATVTKEVGQQPWRLGTWS